MPKDKGKLEAIAIETEMPKPTLYLEGEDVIEGVSVGDKRTLTVQAVCVSVSMDKRDGEESVSQRWEVREIDGDSIEEETDEAKSQMARKVQRKGW